MRACIVSWDKKKLLIYNLIGRKNEKEWRESSLKGRKKYFEIQCKF